jgi:hypothetical protein
MELPSHVSDPNYNTSQQALSLVRKELDQLHDIRGKKVIHPIFLYFEGKLIQLLTHALSTDRVLGIQCWCVIYDEIVEGNPQNG